MPPTPLTKIQPVLTGVVSGGSAANADGHTVENHRGNTYIEVTNGGGGSINVTVNAPAKTRPADAEWPAMALANVVVAVAAGASKIIGPIPTAYNDSGGNVSITFSGVTSVSVVAFNP